MSSQVLGVEDDPDNMKLVTWILEVEGYEVTSAFSAEGCLDILKTKDFDLVLMDISQPGIDGKEASPKLSSKRLKIMRYLHIPHPLGSYCCAYLIQSN